MPRSQGTRQSKVGTVAPRGPTKDFEARESGGVVVKRRPVRQSTARAERHALPFSHFGQGSGDDLIDAFAGGHGRQREALMNRGIDAHHELAGVVGAQGHDSIFNPVTR